METSALITMIGTQATVIVITAYLFWKILKTPLKSEPDSFSENDDVKK